MSAAIVPSSRKNTAALAAAVLALLAWPPGSPAAASDLTTTHRYLQADHAFLLVATHNLGVSHRALLTLLASVRHDCPHAAAGSPQDPESTQLSDEVIGAMVFAGGRPDRTAALAYVAAVRSLHWTDHAVNAEIHGYVTQLLKLTTIPKPGLCEDVEAWAAARFRSLPASTISFDALFYPNWVSAGILPAGLQASESGSDRPLARQTAHMEERVSEFEAHEVQTWGAIMDSLELWP